MNCIPAPATGASGPTRWRYHVLQVVLLVLGMCSLSAPAAENKGSTSLRQLTYGVEYRVTPDPPAGGVAIELRLTQASQLLREMDMRAPAEWIGQVNGDGQVTHSNDRVHWTPPANGGKLRWFATLNHRRSNGGFDSYIEADWAIFRADDIIPAAATRTLKGAESKTSLVFDLPDKWSSATQYFGRDGSYPVNNSERRFDRPTGWVALGRIGVRNDDVSGIRVKVAGPVGQSVRRMDILALLRWTLPDMTRVFPEFPQRLTIISAGDPMWRGGLSAPASLFLHADRPMISENATSTLVHELVHVGFGGSAIPGSDWIIEGLAELYSLETLRRSGTISQERYDAALAKLAKRGEDVKSLCADSARGAITARAVTLLHELDNEIRQHGEPSMSLDEVVRELARADSAVSAEMLQRAAESAIGGPSRTLDAEIIDDCR